MIGHKSDNTQYYRVVKKRHEYIGIRYFKFNPIYEKVVQVVVNQGEKRKGKTNLFGVGLICRTTFLCNYLSMGYVENCSQKEYETKFNDVVKMLE